MQYPSENQRLVSANVLADRIGVKAADLRRAARAGHLPHTRVGNDGILFDEEVVRRILLEQAAKEAISGKRLLTYKEAAQYSSISARKMWELVNRGVIPAVRPDGRMVRLDRADLDAFIEARKK